MAKLKVEVVVGLVNRLSGGLRGMSRDLRGFSRDVSVIGAGMSYGGQQILGTLRGSVEAANALQSELTEVAIVAGKAPAAVAALRPELRAIAREYVQPMLDLAEATAGMTAKGLDWDQARGALPDIARSATATRTKLADMEATAATLIAQLGFDPGRLADPFNRLAASANAGGFEMRDMAQYLPEVVASMAKLDTGERAINNLGAGLQVMRKRAGSAGQAATQFTDLLEKMLSPTVVGALDKKFGVDLPAAMAKWKTAGLDPLEQFVGLMQRVTGGDAFKVSEIFGDKEARAGIVALMSGWAEFAEIRTKAAAAPGQDLIGQMFAARLADDPTLRLQQMSIAVQTLSDQIGGSLTPVLIDLIGRIQPIVVSVGTWIENHRELAGTIALWVGGLGAALAVLGPVAMGLGGIAWAASMVAGVVAAMTAPIWVAVAAVAALVVALTNWDATVALVSQAMGWLIEQIGFDPVAAAVAKWEALAAYFRQWAANLPQIFANAVEAMKSVGRNLIDGLWAGIQERWAALKAKVAGIARSITGIFRSETDTHSPSRVFEAIGLDLMRGLAIGIDRTAGMPLAAVGRAAAGVVAGGAMAFGAAGPVAAAPAIHMPISITIQAPAGMDARALADLVRQQVEAATQQASRGLAALYDQTDGL